MAAAAASVALALAGVAGLGALGEHSQHAPAPAGDHLGMEQGESWPDYAARARASLDAAPADGAVYALVTFRRDAGFSVAAGALDGLERVDAVVFPGMAARAVAEPVAGENRADVFAREAAQVGRAADAAGVAGGGETPTVLSSAVVHAPGERLRDVATRPGVAAVEALPADAVWGAFGVAPVAPPAP